MGRVRVALGAGFAVMAGALLLVLSGSPATVASSNKVPGTETAIASTNRSASYCQAREQLPARTSAIRVWLDAAAGPRVALTVSAGGRVLTSGVRGSNWIGSSVTVPVKPLPHTIAGTTVCVSFQLHDEIVIVQGKAAAPAVAAYTGSGPLAGRMWIEYLRPGKRSWLAQAREVVRRIGLGRDPAGAWIALVALAMLVGAVALASRLLMRELA
jgi:hypothetical protein